VSVKIIVPASLHEITGSKVVEVSGATVEEALGDFTKRFPGAYEKLFGKDGKLLPYIQVFLNKGGSAAEMESRLKDGDEIWLLFVIQGG
jgi:molybdopterin converting factor small subunit